jgi:uncharacterized protein YicC (UPF0701 family)
LVRDTLRRGHVEVTLHIDSAGISGVQINREAAASYLRAVEALRTAFGFEQEPTSSLCFVCPVWSRRTAAPDRSTTTRRND